MRAVTFQDGVYLCASIGVVALVATLGGPIVLGACVLIGNRKRARNRKRAEEIVARRKSEKNHPAGKGL